MLLLARAAPRGLRALASVPPFPGLHPAPPHLHLQVQYSLLDRRPENGMAEFCATHGIKLLPYGVVAGGLLTDRYLGAKPTE